MNSSNYTGNIACTYTDNATCWSDEVRGLNQEYARRMAPVVAMMATFNLTGILGNLLVVFVYAKNLKKTTSRIFMTYLAAIDLFVCVTIHPYIIYKLFHNYDQTWTVACKIFEFLVHASLAVSALTLLVIAVDRFLAICRPLKFQLFYLHIEKAIAATLVSGLCISVPIFEFYGPRSASLEIDSITFVGYKCDFTEDYQGSVSKLIFNAVILTGFLVQIVCMVLLYGRVALTAFRRMKAVAPLPPPAATAREPLALDVTTHALNPSTSFQSQPTVSTRKVDTSANASLYLQVPSAFAVFTKPSATTVDKRPPSAEHALRVNNGTMADKSISSRLKAATILFLVTAVFFLSWFPFFILRVSNVKDNEFPNGENTFRIVMLNILNHLFYVNNAANPIIYVVINRPFRAECKVALVRMFQFRRT